MTVDPKVFLLSLVAIPTPFLTRPFLQAIQHVFHKSGYNYTKKTSQNFMGYLIAGPGIVTMLGKVIYLYRWTILNFIAYLRCT